MLVEYPSQPELTGSSGKRRQQASCSTAGHEQCCLVDPGWRELSIVANIVRPSAAWRRLGIGRSKFYVDFVRAGRLRPVKLGKRASGFFDDEIDALVEEIRRERDAAGRKP